MNREKWGEALLGEQWKYYAIYIVCSDQSLWGITVSLAVWMGSRKIDFIPPTLCGKLRLQGPLKNGFWCLIRVRSFALKDLIASSQGSFPLSRSRGKRRTAIKWLVQGCKAGRGGLGQDASLSGFPSLPVLLPPGPRLHMICSLRGWGLLSAAVEIIKFR